MPNKILVCLDGSELAEQILPYATEQALQFGSKVVFLQVILTSSTVPAMVTGVEPAMTVPVPLDAEQFRMEEEEANAYLNAKAAQLRETGLDVECITILGALPGKTIVSYADENEVDLVAIATHGRSGLSRTIFGSVADHVLRESGLPILVIKPRDKKTK